MKCNHAERASVECLAQGGSLPDFGLLCVASMARSGIIWESDGQHRITTLPSRPWLRPGDVDQQAPAPILKVVVGNHLRIPLLHAVRKGLPGTLYLETIGLLFFSFDVTCAVLHHLL